MGKTALVCGGHGFIGHHLARELKELGYWVRTVDIKDYEYGDLNVDSYIIGDLRDPDFCSRMVWDIFSKPFDEVYQLSADMGGAGYIFSKEHDADVMHNSGLINFNMAEACKFAGVKRIFFSSSACIYNHLLQKDSDNSGLKESDAYPAYPDSVYGWEKLMAEQLYMAYARNYGIDVRIARFHNIMGPEGSWNNGKEKAPAAMCRKVAVANDGDIIDIWGDGEQTRSFLYIDECLNGIMRLMESDFTGPVNIGSDEMVSINQLVDMVKEIAGKTNIKVNHIDGPIGVRGRSSDNTLIREKLGWAPDYPLRKALSKTYPWIEKQIQLGNRDK